MHQALVLSVIGPDRPGLVDRLAKTIAAHQANWVESRLVQLGGQFAGVVRVDAPDAETDRLKHALADLAKTGLHVTVHAVGELSTTEDTPAHSLKLTFIGHDRLGIVRDVSRTLAQAGVNVTELTTRRYSAPMTGEPLFEADIRLTGPAGLDADALHTQLDGIADRLHLDLSLTADTPAADLPNA